MKVVLFDPSGTTNYCNGLANALCKKVDLDVIARDNYEYLKDGNYNLYRYFKLSKSSILNKIQKGLNYISGYLKTIKLVYSNKYEVFHIQWLLLYSVDIFFLKIIKHKVKKIVYTAHNVIPHVNGQKYIRQLEMIYNLADVIVVHGEASKKELIAFFNIDAKKVIVQPHGLNSKEIPSYQMDEVSQNLKDAILSYEGKKYLYLGVIFEAKGVDRLFCYWKEHYRMYPKDLMIIAGKISEYTDNYKRAEKKIMGIPNLLYIPSEISAVDHHYLYENADIILMPYRHASMSGIIFDAATFSKPVLTTDVGCIPEYLQNNIDSFIVPNDDMEFSTKVDKVHAMDAMELKQMGINLNENISRRFNWETIANKLIKDAYE